MSSPGHHRAQDGELYRAAEQGRANAVRSLLAEGADPNRFHADPGGNLTPLMVAAALDSFGSHAEVIRLLAAAGADLDAQDPDPLCLTALMNASMSGNASAVEQLLSYGARRDQKTTSGMTALDYAKKKPAILALFQTTTVTGRPAPDAPRSAPPGQAAAPASSPSDGRNRLVAETMKAMLDLASAPDARLRYVVHASNAEEKYFLMFEGFQHMLAGFADNRKKRLICVAPDEAALSEAKRWYHQLGCLLPLEFETWSRFSFSTVISNPGGDPMEFTEFASRTRDTRAVDKYGHSIPLDPAGFSVLGDLDYSPEKVNWLDTEPTGKWYEIARHKAFQKLFLKRTKVGLRDVLQSREGMSVMFHLPGQRPVFDLPPGAVNSKSIPGAGCLPSVLLLCSAAVSLLWAFLR